MNLTVREKASYGVGAVGKDMVYCIVSGFLLYYYNTVLGISATFIGVLFMVARVLDAVNDPFMGIIVEKTNTRMGKFRPWLLIGTVLSAISLYAMYAVPHSLTGTSLLVYVSAAYIIWGTTYTLMDIPYWSMIPAITQNQKDRENISVIARSCAGLGFAIPTALTMVLVPVLGRGDERTGFQIFAGIISILFIAAIIITVCNVREKTKPILHTPRIREMFQALFKNDQALIVVITIVIFNASVYLTSQLALYFFRYDIGNSALFGIFGTVGGATQILSMLLLPILRKKWDRKRIFTGAILTAIFGYTVLFTLGTFHITNLVLLCIAAIIIYFGFGLATVLTTVFLADTVDYGEWKTKQRSESVIFSMQTFVVQLASAFSALIAGIGIDLIKLDVNAKVQTAATLGGLRVFMIIIPMIGLLLSVLFFRRRYRLSEDTMGQIQSELKEEEDRKEGRGYAAMIRREKDLFLLDTLNTTYCFRVMSSGHLEHLYYGRTINLSGGYEPLIQKTSFIGGSSLAYAKEYPQLGLEDICLEMSSYGKGDIREAFLELIHEDGNVTCDFLFKEARLLSEKKPLETLPFGYQGVSEGKSTKNYNSLEIELWEKYYNITLILTYSVFDQCDVITRSARIMNHSDKTVLLRRIMSTQLDLEDCDYRITTFHGTWAREMERYDTDAIPGIYVNDSKAGISSNRSNPFFFVSEAGTDEDHGSCYGFNLIYSGNHYAAMQVNSMGKLRIIQGIHPHNFMVHLEPSKSFEAPESVMTYTHNGWNTMSHNMHSFIRNHIVRGEWRDKERPVLLNSWEANYFKFNDNKLITQAKAAKEAGIELFVLDDGWFGRRNDDTSSLGDWRENRDKLKSGLKGLADRINELGLEFGIWVEPEMVNEISELYQSHPDWAVKVPGQEQSLGRNQMLLDLTREEVCSYLIEEMSRVFSSANITYVKWDMNRIFSDYYSSSLSPQRQQEFSHRYVLGLYYVLKELTKRFPKILFESCASGGNRFDLGMLCYMPQTWASDNTDAICRATIQNGYSYGYPMSVIGAHVSGCPNHQTLRNTSLETRFEVAAYGLLGYECNLAELRSEEKKLVQEQISFYKKYRKVLQYGNFYRIKNGEGGIYQWMTVAKDQSFAFGLFLQKEVKANFSYGCFRTKGLAPQVCYRMTNRKQVFNIKEFGDLINMISPIHIKKDSLAHNIVARLKKMPGEVEDCTAFGEVFNNAGVKLKQGFSGTGYNEEVRLFQDYASRLYIWEALSDSNRP